MNKLFNFYIQYTTIKLNVNRMSINFALIFYYII
jgi:hypothetical protein